MCQFSVKMDNFDLFWLKFAQKWILGFQFQKTKSGFGISTSKFPCVLTFIQNRQLCTFRPKFAEIAQYVQY